MQIVHCHYSAPWLGEVGIVTCFYRDERLLHRVSVPVWPHGGVKYEDVLALPLEVLEAMAAVIRSKNYPVLGEE